MLTTEARPLGAAGRPRSPATMRRQRRQRGQGSGQDVDFDVGDTFQIDNTLPFGGDFAQFTLNYTAPDGSIVVANLYSYENPNFDCKLTGIAIGA